MADNTVLASGSGGDTIRTEDRTTYKTPVSLIDVGGTSGEALIGDAGVGMPTEGMAAENAAAAGNPLLVGARYDATPRTLGDGDVGAIALDADGAVHISDGGNTITVDGTVTANLGATDNAVLDSILAALQGTLTVGSHAVTNAGTFAVQVSGDALTALQLLDDAVYTDGTGTPSKGIAVMGSDGTNPQLIAVDSSGNVQVDLVSANVTNAGTFAVQAAQSGAWSITNISGTVSLPTGAATAAKQPALGTAGVASADVITVQGIASMTAIVVDGSGVTQPVSAASLPLPTGASTSANQTTIIGHLDGVEALLTTIDADTGTLAGAVSGTEMQVDVVAALPAGTNNIGDVDVATQPARDRLTDNVGAALQTDVILNDTTALTPKFAAIDAATSGDNTLVAAVATKKIRVLAVWMVAAAAVTARFEDGAGGTALTGQMNLAANGGFVLPFNPVGWFETTANTLLNLELGGAVSVDGSLVYVEV